VARRLVRYGWAVSRYLVPCSAVFLAVIGCQASSPKGTPERLPAAIASAQPRTPELIRREGNHLVGAGSAYLRQHSHNPVDWYSWGPEALALAVKLDRPIFLSIGYVSCHWCHVMEKEVFEHDDVAAFLNEHFISIKVDREERPDLDSVYMEAVQAMTGSGGWPMTAFLTPSLRPFFGGTYFPYDRFLQVVRSAEEQFRTARNDVESRGAEVYKHIASTEPAGNGSGFESGELRAIAQRALGDIDANLGGFRGRQKFPTPIKWRFLLDVYRKWGDEEIGRVVRKTLDAMAAGGIHDQIGGGFFRYSTEPSWTIPHFEKMLYDNAQLAVLYLEAAAAFDEPRYRAIGLHTLDFLLRDMRTREQGFGASFDADTNGKEGASYLWTPSELRAVAGDADGRVLSELLGVTDAGNFEGSNVPTFSADGAANPQNLKVWEQWRPKVLEARQHRAQPSFDPKMVTAWNGLAIGALAVGYRASSEQRFLDAAEQAADAVWRLNHRPSGGLARASDNGRAGDPAVLDDHAFLASGLVDLFEATSKPAYLEHAIALATEATARFSNPSGGWFLTAGSDQEPLGRRLDISDGVEPSGSAAMILLLEELSALTGRSDLGAAATKALHQYAGTVRQRGLDMAGWLDGVLLDEGPFYELVIAGGSGPLADTWNHLLPSWAVGVRIPAERPAPELEKVMPTVSAKHARGDASLAYVCVRGSCKEPTSDPAKLRAEILGGWNR
jgi:uncharacterized protein YyaL (SSP411 family)